MDAELSTVFSNGSTQALVEIVKLTQKKGMKGCKGVWKDFLNSQDTKLGSSLSDPAKRPRSTLISFLCTFTNDIDLQFLEKAFRAHSNREATEYILGNGAENESPEQGLVRLTRKHPLYPSNYVFPYDEEWAIKNVSEKKIATGPIDLLAIDCEMVLCADGSDAVVRVCVVDRNLQVKLDKLVNPGRPVLDYRTDITGVSAGDFDSVSRTLVSVQNKIRKLVTKQTILVGHSLYNDLLALKFDYAMVIDTSLIFKTVDGSTPSLNDLCKFHLGYQLRKDGFPHDCKEDALAAMKLALFKIQQGLDKDLPLVERDAKHLPESGMSKLLIHRVPFDVPIEELRRIFPQNVAVDLKLQKNSRAVYYSALAHFSDAQEAQNAFDAVKGGVEKDKNGLLQKLVTFNHKSGSEVSVFVRKMGHESAVQVSEQGQEDMKRSLDDNSISGRMKKSRKENDSDDLCCDHLRVIGALKDEINSKRCEIEARDKMLVLLQKEVEEVKKTRKPRCGNCRQGKNTRNGKHFG